MFYTALSVCGNVHMCFTLETFRWFNFMLICHYFELIKLMNDKINNENVNKTEDDLHIF